MKLIRVIREKDLGLDTSTSVVYKERSAARAIVFDKDKRVALLDATKNSYHKLPGGGIESGESVEAALRRELLEEIGCRISNIRELGVIEEYRNDSLDMHQISYCFLADLDGEKGEPHLEAAEVADGFQPVWKPIQDAIKTLEDEVGIESYEGKFIRLRDLTFLQAAQATLGQ